MKEIMEKIISIEIVDDEVITFSTTTLSISYSIKWLAIGLTGSSFVEAVPYGLQ